MRIFGTIAAMKPTRPMVAGSIKRFLRRLVTLRLLVQVAILVLSILLAFAIDAWWDAHQERSRERDLLLELRDDFRANRPGLESRVTLARRMAEGTGEFLDLLGAHAAPEVVTVPHAVIFAALGGPTYEPVTNALDAAVASGDIALLTNGELRAELATWRRLLRDTNEDELEVRRITNEQIVPLLSQSLDLGPYFEGLLSWSGGDSHFSGRRVGGGAKGVAQDGVPVPASTGLAGALAMRRFYVEFAAADLQDLLDSVDRSITLIEDQLEGWN